ncbi:hypothetical protein [Achromobacter pestifer]
MNNSSALINRSIAQRYTTQFTLSYLIATMKTVEEIRLDRLRELVAEAGSIANLNRAAKRNERDATISQILNRWSGKSGKPKELGSDMARELEVAMNKPRGWMDNAPVSGVEWPFTEISPADYSSLSDVERGKIEERAMMLIEAKRAKSPIAAA